jgi:hypothetical protein
MNLQGRSLQQGLTGTDVAALQSQLTMLGMTVPAAETQASSFGAGTLTAVKQFQTAYGLQPTGVVDTATAEAIGTAVDGVSYVVTGTVWSPNHAGVGGMNVQIVDKNVGQDVSLGSAITDANGRYRTRVMLPPATAQKASPDLQARVLAGTTFLAASIVRYNAKRVTTLDVILPAGTTLPASEYETLTTATRTVYQGAFGALQENATQQDVTYLANKIGWDARAVAFAAIADQLGTQAVTHPSAPAGVTATAAAPAPGPVPAPGPAPGPAPTPAPAPAPGPAAPTIKPEFYYALFRAGLPTTPERLYQVDSNTVQNVWQQAVAQGIIPQALSSEIAGAVQSFQTLNAGHSLDAKPIVGVSTLREMLTVSLTDATQQQQFSQLRAQNQGNDTALWAAVEQSLGATTTAKLQLDGKLGYLTMNNAPLITALHKAEQASPITSTLDLVSKGYYDAAKWQPLIGTNVPPQMRGGTAAEKAANYAKSLATQVKLAHPTAVVADLIKKGTVPVQGGATVAANVTTFLAANQGKFEIGLEPVDAYLTRTKVTGPDPAALAQIRRVQRVYQLTPDDQSLSTLLQANLDSAYAITRYDRAGFVSSLQGTLGGPIAADRIYSRAQQVYGSVLSATMHYLTAQTGLALGGALGVPILNTKSQPPASPSYPIIAYPTLEELFGSLDYCECDDCRSILSPAAYLVDLLQFIDAQSVPFGFLNPQTVLFGRRPDIQYLPLTCANTNTALPYIDIVNETLEYFVSHSLSLSGFQGFTTDDTITSAELLAIPQNVDDTAYGILQTAYFPPPLPFQRPLGLLRLQLAKIGVTLPAVMTALRANDAIERGGSTVYGWRDILMEQLGLSREEYRIFTDRTIGLRGLYGYTSLTEAAALALLQNQNLQDFSRRTGVSYDDMFSIVQTRFINPNSTLIGPLEALNMPFTTLQQLENGTITAAAFKAALPTGIDAREYGGTSATNLDAIVTWVKNNYTRIMTIITYTDPSEDPNLCSATNLVLRYTNPDASKNLLTGADFMRLIRFIRLWQKLGLTIDQTDDILAALYPAADLPTGASDAADYQLLDKGFLSLLPALGFLYQVMATLGLSTDSLSTLLACWAPIDTTGDDSLYAAMFLTTPLQDPAFAIDAYGNFLQDATQTVGGATGHEATLCAAFNLTGAEFELVLTACGLTDASPLTLANISAIYRVGWLAHTLQLSVVEFLLLRQFSGLDPFKPLDPSPTPPAEPPVVRFIRLVQAIGAAGLQSVQALYLIWNQDVSGTSAPPDADITSLAASLRANFAAVESQFTLVDDPTGAIANGLMAMVYGSAATDFFFGLLNGTLTTATAYASASGAVPQPILAASGGRLSYDDLRKQLTFTGVLDTATQAAIDAAITANGNDAVLHAALASLAAANHQTVDPFFATYPELLPLYTAYAASSDPPQTKRTTLLANFLPSLKDKRKQEQALAAISAAAGADPSFAAAILQDPTVLHSAASPIDAAIVDLTAIEAQGLSAKYYLTNNPALAPDKSVDAVATMNYGPGAAAHPLPAGTGGSAIAATWSGYISAPQDGFYNVAIAADPGATVSLALDGTAVTLAASGGVFKNQSPISLTAGELVPITLQAASLKTIFSFSWETLGLGWQVVAGANLYPATLMDRLRQAYVRFLKATSLASTLALTADEIASLDTYERVRVNTTDGVDTLAAGAVTFTPASIANIAVGSALVIGSGGSQETVTVTAVTPATTTTPARFSAVTTKPHDGTVTPFPIVSQAAPIIGQGWFNFLPVSGDPDAALSARLRDVLTALLDFARIKTALSSSDERVLDALQDPAATAPDGTLPLLTLTGWTLDSLQALLQQFFGSTDLAALGDVEAFRRVYDAYAIVSTCRVSAGALIQATTNDPTPSQIGGLQSALRALYAEADWLTAVKPINDTMRQAQRDALVAWILQQLGDQPPSKPPAPTDLSNVNTADKLFEYFLIDAETEPPVETSRIRLALSAVQLFIERCLRNLEPQASSTNVDPAKWEWMKRYRVWEANREVFLWPENWLYPELRDDQSPIFQQMMSALLQSDITDDAAQEAYLDYLSNLELVAKLEPCGLYYVPGVANESNEISYVVGRTTGTGAKYYFRQFANGSWSPWVQMPIDPEDLPVTPIVWNGRLFVFWLKMARQTPVSTSSMQTDPDTTSLAAQTIGAMQGAAQSSASQQTQVTVTASLCWSEFYNNKWQPTKMSDLRRQTKVGTFAADDTTFDAQRSLLRLLPTVLSGGDFDGALQLEISSPLGNAKGGFVLHNTHTSPIRMEDMAPGSGGLVILGFFGPSRDLAPMLPYTGGSVSATFEIKYWSGGFLFGFGPADDNSLFTTGLVPRYVLPQDGVPDPWDAPFLFEDQRNAFYVSCSNRMVTIFDFTGYGTPWNYGALFGSSSSIPWYVFQEAAPILPYQGDPSIFTFTPESGDPSTMQSYVSADPNVRRAIGTAKVVTYQGQVIGADGSIGALGQPSDLLRN